MLRTPAARSLPKGIRLRGKDSDYQDFKIEHNFKAVPGCRTVTWLLLPRALKDKRLGRETCRLYDAIENQLDVGNVIQNVDVPIQVHVRNDEKEIVDVPIQVHVRNDEINNRQR